MWGDPETAQQLDDNPDLVSILFQVTGPAHIPWQDPIWQEVLSHYNVWVHCAAPAAASALQRACHNTVTHAPRSSNLAALAQHVTVLLQHYAPRPPDGASVPVMGNSTNNRSSNHNNTSTADAEVAAFSHRIALVSKARALAGALQLLRILSHAVVADYRGLAATPSVRRNDSFTRSDDETLQGRRRRSLERNNASSSSSTTTAHGDRLQQVFTYQSRAAGDVARDVGHNLMQSLLAFLVEQHQPHMFPELYDCYCLAQQLVLVLLSTQLYESFRSSFAGDERNAPPVRGQQQQQERYDFWKPCLRHTQLASVLLQSTVQRQAPPAKSIQHHHTYLSQQVAEASHTTVKRGPDGLYETHTIVQANSRRRHEIDPTDEANGQALVKPHHASHSPILDATKGVLVLSSSILMLPFRLVSLALGLLGGGGSGSHNGRSGRQTRVSNSNDVLWLTDSPLADLSTALVLLLVNGYRSHSPHVVRSELALLSDNRWETSLPDLPTMEDDSQMGSFRSTTSVQQPATTAVNFEALFSTLGSTAHTEAGALWLYTLLQSSPAFAESVAVRSDLDTLVLPLLRTLYFTTVARLYTTSTAGGSSTPFRSISQLYVTIILLLLFSQDPSFGADAFRRVMVPAVPWYKERNLKDISLGSVLLLTLLRCLAFVLYRQPDAFLLSNCCAVLMNISSSVQDLHDWAAMRLVDSAVSTLQRYVQLRHTMATNDDENDITTPVGMYGEAARTLLCVLKQALSVKHIERNIHLVYALVYHQASLQQVLGQKADSPFSKKETSRIQVVLNTATRIIADDGNARTAPKALKILSDKVKLLQDAVAAEKRQKKTEEFMFTYEEEADPEVFFVPYVWEVIVCVLTASSIEWQKDRIQVFGVATAPAADQVDTTTGTLNGDAPSETKSNENSGQSNGHHFAYDASDVV